MFNKIAGAVLGTLLVLVVLRIAAEELFGPEEPEHDEVGHEEVALTPEQMLLMRIAEADPQDGAGAATTCAGCHSLNEGGAHMFGPNLFDVVGSPIASKEGFDYSDALDELNAEGAVWTYENLDAFLANPGAFAPGTAMPANVPDEDNRAAIIAYLRTLSNEPEPLPEVEGGADAAGDHEEGELTLEDMVAAADAQAGASVAGGCAGCHTLNEGGQNGFGPNLYGVVGAPIGGHEDFAYSEALAELNAEGAVWSLENLDAFIHAPSEFAPGTAMPYAGLNDEEDRHNLLAYLATLGGEIADEPAAEEPAAEEPAAEEPAAEEPAEEALPEPPAAFEPDDPAMVDHAAIAAAGDVANGEGAFGACGGCHTIQEGAPSGFGPNLFGVVGRPVGGLEGYNYSDAMADLHTAGAIWTAERLDAFLENPSEAIPGNNMPFPGIADAERRTDIIAFLATLMPGDDAAEEPAAEEAAAEEPAAEEPAAEEPAEEEAAAEEPAAEEPAAEEPAAEEPAAEEPAAEEAAAEEPAAEDAVAAAVGDDPALVDHAAIAAAGEVANGENAFGACAGCHTIQEGAPSGFGPNLFGVVGRPVGGLEGFAYSDALAELYEAGAIWTAERLDAFIESPATAIPGNRMPFPGVADAEARADIIAFLATLMPEDAAAEPAAADAAAVEEPAAEEADAEEPAAEEPAAEEPAAEEPAAEELAADEAVAEEPAAEEAVGEEPAAEEAVAAAGDDPAMVDHAAIVAAGDVANGENAFGGCAGCHTIQEGAPNGFGPNLFGVVGRPVGGLEGYAYSDAMAELNAEGAIWTAERLDAFLESPATAIPGNRMPFPGVADAEARADIIAFLATLMPEGAGDEAAAEEVPADEPVLGEPAEDLAPAEGAAADLEPATFTIQQVGWGEFQYGAECASCHGENLEGGDAVALVGDDFEDTWLGRPVSELVTAMSEGDAHPGDEIADVDYAGIVAFILSENDFEADGAPLSPSLDDLAGIGIVQ